MSQVFKNNECSDKMRFDYLEMHTNSILTSILRLNIASFFCGRRRVAVARYRMICLVLLFNRHCNVMSVRFLIGQPCDLPVNGSYSVFQKVLLLIHMYFELF